MQTLLILVGYASRSHLAYHDLSKSARKWGVLGCILTHYLALEYQVLRVLS